jgi:23S rRNA (cytidine1920-2'-O)/16S rRNA (cytidine1409-2'-O)-methyltransferase
MRRLDVLVFERGLAASREQARRLIQAGQVSVRGQIATKVGAAVDPEAEIRVLPGPAYVSRGGHKLAKALEQFAIAVENRVAADVGASTGGFTDCLLQRGARRVYAIDVGYGQLAWTLRQDARVVVLERTNARYLEALPEQVSLVVMDVSFISIHHILPQVRRWLTPQGEVVALIKPQFEAGRRSVGKGGVVRDHAVHRQVLHQVLQRARDEGWALLGLTPSPITGPKGNVEFLAWLMPEEGLASLSVDEAIARAMSDLAADRPS